MNPRRATPQGPKPCALDQAWLPPPIFRYYYDFSSFKALVVSFSPSIEAFWNFSLFSEEFERSKACKSTTYMFSRRILMVKSPM